MQKSSEAKVRGLKLSHLRLMAEILATGQLSHAAERLGLAQPAASRLLAEAERLTGQPLHQRDGRGLRLTAAGAALARRAARIQIELSDAAREMGEAGSGTEGLVRIGAVTGPALNRVLPVVRDLGARHPGLRFEVAVGTSPPLCDQLLAGKLDFAIGRLLSPDLERSLTMEVMEAEPVSLIVRRGHPLLFRPDLRPADTLAYDWVMPEGETLLTRTVVDGLAALGLGEPRRQVSTASFLFTLALLTESDAIAPLAEAVAESFALGPAMPFVRLPVETGIIVAAYGLIRRRGGHLPPAAEGVAARILSSTPRPRP